MPHLTCTARRIGDYESRTEEYELSYAFDGNEPRVLEVRYFAARAYEINAALDAAAETAREAIAASDPELAKAASDDPLYKLTWRTLQSAKYEEGAPKTSSVEL